ncbi:PASTA domain-containing protein [Streptomyces niveus]|uniref:PASTA domain-containing protein n=1 Tax=Streptomyces niveus TaxID=193462 RepID=UPI003422B2AA
MRKLLVTAVIIAALVALSNHSRKQRSTLPDLTGLTLSHAQNRARAEGFNRLTSQDAGREDRPQLLAGNWKVCAQTPPPGDHSVTTPVEVSVVKTDETCPRG